MYYVVVPTVYRATGLVCADIEMGTAERTAICQAAIPSEPSGNPNEFALEFLIEAEPLPLEDIDLPVETLDLPMKLLEAKAVGRFGDLIHR